MTHTPFAARRLTVLALPLLLASCVDPAPVPPSFTGAASLGGVLVQGAGQPALPGSEVSLYPAGDHSRLLARTQTGAAGEFSFASLAAGRYDLAFADPGFAASEVLGAVAREGVTPLYTAEQRPVRDPGGLLSAPQLVTARTDSAAGSAGPLPTDRPSAFSGRLGLRVRTAAGSPHQRPLRAFEVTLLQANPDGSLAALHPAGGVAAPGPSADVADSGALSLDPGPVAGDALLQVTATDFNNNRVAALYPVAITPVAGGPVGAPDDVRAVAYTWARGTDVGAAAQGLAAQAVRSSLPTLKVQVSWSVPDASGVRGFELWRAPSAAGPWTRAVLAGPDACSGGACGVADTSAGLQIGQDLFYRVSAVGTNRADSAQGSQPSTHPLPLFVPELMDPDLTNPNLATGPAGGPPTPSYAVHSPLAALGAGGAVLNLSVRDDLLGSGTPWQAQLLVRQVYGQTGQPAGQADAQVLLSRGGRYETVYSSLAPSSSLAGVSYDARAEQLTVQHNFDASGQALQFARRYRLTLDRAAAFRLADPGSPPGALNPVVAYSVFSDPAGSGAQACPAQPIIPGGPCLDAGRSLEFSTGAAR